MKTPVRFLLLAGFLVGGVAFFSFFQNVEASVTNIYSRMSAYKTTRLQNTIARKATTPVSPVTTTPVASSDTGKSSSCSCEAKALPASVMTLEKFNEEPQKCPTGWKEAGYGIDWSDGGKNSYTRTCYTSAQCAVMQLELFNGTPNTCPAGWSEADFGKQWIEGGQSKFSRTCYLCA
jgi:hypothetical protein